MLNKLIVGCTGMVLLTGVMASTVVNADEVKTTQKDTHMERDKTSENLKTLIIAANGKLEGQMVPYIDGLDYTGKMTLHYTAQNAGFVDGDVGVLMVKLPEEFKYVASDPKFAGCITGDISTTTIFGENAKKINPDRIKVYSDRVLIMVPSSLWCGVGSVSANIVMDYGSYVSSHPKIIPHASQGYKFVTQLKYNSAMWDIIKNPIIGTNETLYTTDKDAVLPENQVQNNVK